jgi:hypothetical protein
MTHLYIYRIFFFCKQASWSYSHKVDGGNVYLLSYGSVSYGTIWNIRNTFTRKLSAKQHGNQKTRQLDKILTKNKAKMLQQYHSGLEHTFIWIVDAQEAHSVQNLMMESGWIKFNTLKIVPLVTYENVLKNLETA